MVDCPNHQHEPGVPRKLRVLIITFPESERKSHLVHLFSSNPLLSQHFAPPCFSNGVSSRRLRSRCEFLQSAREAGLISNDDEWQALCQAMNDPFYKENTDKFFDCLKNVPVEPGRRGSSLDVSLHYSVELWRKAKTLNRNRAVLACTFAHLIAMKRFVTDGASFDVIIEDNVRLPVHHCARRILETVQASTEWQQESGTECHFRYYGWLGSIPNLRWITTSHMEKRKFRRRSSDTVSPLGDDSSCSVLPFPTNQDIETDLAAMKEINFMNEKGGEQEENQKTEREPGGNPVWGAYAYWISKEGYERVIASLRKDVGALMWKGKRARAYNVKPIDKILPRKIMEIFGQDACQLATYPAFFRAPMLTSKIHTQWDPEFCRSTEFQLAQSGLTWHDLWLTPFERAIVAHNEQHGVWLTLGELEASYTSIG